MGAQLDVVTRSDRLHMDLRNRIGRASRAALLLLIMLAACEMALRAGGWIIIRQRAYALEPPVTSPPDAIRILSIGESTTFGLGVDPQSAYPAVVARLLEDRYPGKTFVSINRGVPGLTSTAMARTFAAKLAAVHPHLVTINAGANDFSRRLNWQIEERNTVLPGWLYRGMTSLRLYKVFRFFLEKQRPTIRTWRGDITYDNGTGADYKSLTSEHPRDEEQIAAVVAQLTANLREMITASRNSGSAVVLVGYLHPYVDLSTQILKQVASATSVPFVSTTLSRDESTPDFYIPDGWHPSPLGHRHLAERVVSEVVDRGLLANVVGPPRAMPTIAAIPNPVPADSRRGTGARASSQRLLFR